MEAILSRHSVRDFVAGEISEDVLEKILHAGMSAPSAMNSRPWHFILVTDRKKLDGVAEVHPYAKMSLKASAGILICGEPGKEFYQMYFEQDCAAAVENILIAASDLGLGAVWVGLYPNEEYVKKFSNYFNIPETVMPFAWIPIVVPTERPKPDNRLDLSKVHHNLW